MCVLLYNSSIKKINEAQSLQEIKNGLEHAKYLFRRINRLVAKCEDINNEHAMNIYKVTGLSSGVNSNIEKFITQ